MRASRLLSVISVGALVLLAVGCAGPTPSPGTTPTTEPAPPTASPLDASVPDPRGMTPEETVTAFYGWYIEHGGGALQDGSLEATGYLTDEHLRRLREATAGFVGGGADLLLCAQDVPSSVAVEASSVEGNRAAVLVSTSFAGHALEIELPREGDHWRIDRVHCTPQTLSFPPTPTPPSVAASMEVTALDWTVYMDAAETWPTYRSDEFGFALRHPEGWVSREFRAGLGEAPIGPQNVRLAVQFMPGEWAARAPGPMAPAITPFVLEVSVGSLEEYRAYNPEPARSATLDALGPGAAWEEEAITESLSLHRYVFEHPDDPSVRVTFLDPISGFPDRLASDAAAVEAFRSIVATFRFLGSEVGR